MKEIQDSAQLQAYMNQYGFQDIFNEKLKSSMTLYDFERGELICSQGDLAESLYILVKGKIKVFTTSPEGRSLILNFTTPVEVIGDIEYVQNIKIMNTVEAVTPVQMIGVPCRLMRKYGQDSPALLSFLLDVITRKFHQKNNTLRFNLLYPVEVRLASYLLSVTYDDSDPGYQGKLSTLVLTDVANLIGTSYRHLNRTIRKMCQDGLIIRSKGFLIVKDREGLSRIADKNIYE